jgi:hypothetical protein
LTKKDKSGSNSSRTTKSFTVVSNVTFDVATVYQDGAQDYVIDQKYLHLKTEDKTKPFLGAASMLPKPGSFTTAKVRAEMAHEKHVSL